MLETGTATSHKDLLAKLRTFVTATLSAPEQWTEHRYTTGSSDELILEGPGSGTDQIFVGMKTIEDGVGDYYNWKLGGFTGYLGSSAFEAQPNYSGEAYSPLHMPLWNSSIPYWFVANGRRIIVVAKVSTRYLWSYLGFPLAYASPGQYPYPLIVAGPLSWGITTPPATTSPNWRWSYNGIELSNPTHCFWNQVTEPPFGYTNRSQFRLRTPGGVWRDIFAGWSSGYTPDTLTNIQQRIYNSNGDLAYWRDIPEDVAQVSSLWPMCHQMDAMEAALDGSYVALPILIMMGVWSGDAPDLVGELDGIVAVTGGPSAEDIITIGGVDHLVVPNVFRQNREDFVAIKLA